MINYIIGIGAALMVILSIYNFIKKSKSNNSYAGCSGCSSGNHCSHKQ
ncbi:FeoB-associated Cys-rich membrane protein [Terrisporobacter mayombei]|nr:FeoB-associated Cys-rich membrane protein [Terrisporobacter mayombei]